ncbi:ATP-dependent helicase [Arthrobacter sp. NPDC090010]|uniref:ATP-dependent helicase n=1 Tax=Arthrobacter sp. NPDC090010 TaxID=3363942 RepID=UPI0037FB6FD1
MNPVTDELRRAQPGGRERVKPVLLAPLEKAGKRPRLSPDQEAVAELVRGSGPAVLWGAPGTGKSTVLVESAVRRVEAGEADPERILVLAPSRASSAALRDRLTGSLGRSLGTTPARSWASYAFDVIRRAHREGILGLDGPPRLLSGPEQDQVIKDLLSAPGRERSWPRDLNAALATRGFRQEVRELFDRLIEHDGEAEDLEDLAVRLGRPEWSAASHFYREYRDVMDLRNSGAFDPAGIIAAARQVFALSPEFLAAERDRLDLILVDDLHEASWSVYELFLDLCQGKDVLATVCPDTAVQGFRGARPDLVPQLARQLGGPEGPAQVHELTVSHRLPDRVASAYLRAAERIPRGADALRGRVLSAVPGTAGRSEDPVDAEAAPTEEEVTATVFHGSGHELRYLAGQIQAEHLKGGRGLEDMAVLVRNGAEVARVQRYLLSRGIPVRVALGETAVRDEIAVRPLLEIMGIVLGQAELDPERAVALLSSRVGGASSLDIRRLRQRLRTVERASGGGRNSDELLIDALNEPHWLEDLGLEARHAVRIARMLAAGHRAAAEPAANGETVLWAVWKASALATPWAETALDSGPSGARADRDLDAVMALFESAERFATQFPGSGAAQFYDYLTTQELPMDTLTARPPVEEAVEILTPAGAAGREWPVVFIAGVQEGVWPNTRLRGELLGNTLLADALEHGAEVALQQGPGERLRAVRTDELRTFACALSRASERMVLTAVDDGETSPSAFLELAVPGASDTVERETGRAMDLRSLVSELRRESEEHHAARIAAQPVDRADLRPDRRTVSGGGAFSEGRLLTEEESADAAAVLALLSRHGVPGANPAQWWGLLPASTEDHLVPDGGTVVVSPSKVEKAHDSPLEWFVPAAGGEAHTDFARSLGTLIHAIAADLPRAGLDEYLESLEKRWPELGLPEGWENDALRRRAEQMLFKLASYVASLQASGRTLTAVEIDFAVDLPEAIEVPDTKGTTAKGSAAETVRTVQARIRGQIDRLEVDAEGRAYVVDLKTGKSKPKKDEIDRHAQLGTYQAAINHGAFADGDTALASSGGAALVQLGDSTKGFTEQQQPALESEDGWAMELVHEAAGAMAGNEFEARHESAGTPFGGCKTPEVCPLCHSGRQVTE